MVGERRQGRQIANAKRTAILEGAESKTREGDEAPPSVSTSIWRRDARAGRSNASSMREGSRPSRALNCAARQRNAAIRRETSFDRPTKDQRLAMLKDCEDGQPIELRVDCLGLGKRDHRHALRFLELKLQLLDPHLRMVPPTAPG